MPIAGRMGVALVVSRASNRLNFGDKIIDAGDNADRSKPCRKYIWKKRLILSPNGRRGDKQ